MPSVVIAGASGLVGSATLENVLSRQGWTDVIALSRRVPEVDTTREFRHLPVDLRDAEAARSALKDLRGVTHLVYTALYEQPGLIEGWSDPEQMQTNLAMLRNTLEPILESSSLRHITLLQGTKAYGIHLHPMPIPARERAPRDPHDNFYWLQEDYLKEQADAHGFAWTILRPQLIIGRPWGVAMNLAPIIGVYAAICREEGRPFAFTGGVPYVWEAVDARLVADVIEWAGSSPAAVNEHFNVTNGDVSSGATCGPAWPRCSASRWVPTIPSRWLRCSEQGRGLADDRRQARAAPDRAVRDPRRIALLRGFLLRLRRDQAPPPAFSSRIKLQQAGFTGCRDTQDTFNYWLRDLIHRRLIPGPVSET